MPISSPKPKSRQTNHTLEPNNNPLPPRLKHKHINHVNIALDPITHLNNIDHIVDDISHEIVHRHRHSPNKNLETEANNVELMKEFARRTIHLDKSAKDLRLVHNNEELDTTNENSDWKKKTRFIEKRARGWMSRFQKDMRQGGRVETTPDVEDDNGRLLIRSKSFKTVTRAATQFAEENRPQRPARPQMETVSDLQPFSDRLLKSCLCVVCFHTVGIDAERMSCEHCPVVAHGACISNKASLFPPEEKVRAHFSPKVRACFGGSVKVGSTTIHSHGSSGDMFDSFDDFSVDLNSSRSPSQSQSESPWSMEKNSASTSSRNLTDQMTTGTRHRWTCPFCIHEVKLGNKHRQEKYIAAMTEHAEKQAVLMLQRNVRMFPLKKQFANLIAAAIVLQRFHRSQHMRRALIKSRLLQRRPLRLCIHEVTIIYEVPVHLSHGHGHSHSHSHSGTSPTKSVAFLPMRDGTSDSTSGGIQPAPRVFCQFSTNNLPKSIYSKLIPPAPLTDLALLPCDHQSLKATNTELRRTAMLNLLQLGHRMESPTAMHTSSQAQLTTLDQKSVSYPANTVFLTITVQHYEHGRDLQLYRDDVPLYLLQDPALHPHHGQEGGAQPVSDYAGHYKVLDEVSRVVEGGALRRKQLRGTSAAGTGGGGGGVKAMKIYPPHSLIVIPSCPADVTIYLTISRVTEWPKSCIIGQSMLKSDHLTIWRQCVCMSQNFNIKHIEEEPKSDNNSRLQLFVSKPKAPVTANAATQPLTSRGSITARGSASSRRTSQDQASLPDISCRSSMGPSSSRLNTSRSTGKHDEHDLASKEIVGGHILWSFVSTPPFGNMFGYLQSMATASQLSYKKKCWVVLLDGHLLIYTRATDVKPKEVIQLKTCYFTVLEKVIMKIFRAKDSQSWFFMSSYANKRDMWTDAFQESSIAQTGRIGGGRKGKHSQNGSSASASSPGKPTGLLTPNKGRSTRL